MRGASLPRVAIAGEKRSEQKNVSSTRTTRGDCAMQTRLHDITEPSPLLGDHETWRDSDRKTHLRPLDASEKAVGHGGGSRPQCRTCHGHGLVDCGVGGSGEEEELERGDAQDLREGGGNEVMKWRRIRGREGKEWRARNEKIEQ